MSMLLTAQAMKLKIGNPARKLVLLKLADNANDDGVCFPSYANIAAHCEMTERSAISHINALIEMGLISKKRRKTENGDTSNLYILHLERGEKNSYQGVKNFHPGGEKHDKEGVKNFHPESININQSINQSLSWEPEKTPADEKNKIDYQGVMNVWNLVFGDTVIHNLQKLNDDRKRKIDKVAKDLISEFGSASPKTFEDYFRDFLGQASERKDRFYFGGINGDKWIADFDYVVRPSTLLKTLENAL